MIRCIIFDLDGTLLDTLEDLKNSVNYALDRFDNPPVSKEFVRRAIGNGVPKLIERCIPDGLANPKYERTLEVFKEHYLENACVNTKPYPGIQHVIAKLKEDGYRLAVCTNKIQSVADELVKKFFGSNFSYVQGEIEGVEHKPHPAMMNRVLARFVRPRKEEVLYVGDTEVDERTAYRAEVPYVLVSYGYRTRDEQRIKTPYARIVGTPEQLYDFIKKQDY